jgi:hypothetical protein
MDPQVTFVRIEVLNSHLQMIATMLDCCTRDAAFLDNVATVKLGEACERVSDVRVWLTTWQRSIEEQLTTKATR